MAKYWQKSDRDTPITKAQIALLHVAKKELGLEEADYRSVLSLYGGVDSAANMHLEGFRNVLAYLERMGFKNASGKVYQLRAKSPNSDPTDLPYPAHLKKMQDLFAILDIGEANRQQGFCQRVIKKSWPQTKAEATKIIEGLKAILARK